MDIDARKPIAGIKPALLKRLLKQECFSTPTAMKWLQLQEPDVTRRLRALHRAGWVDFRCRDDGVDYWTAGELGQRLRATRLMMKRIPVDEGRRILDRLIEEARAINADPARSRRVERILVFGSLLAPAPDGTIGDVDVVVNLQRRVVTADVLQALEAAENATRPEGTRGLAWYHWPDVRIFRRLAALSRYISLHQEGDIRATETPYREAYAYDLMREREALPDAEIRRMVNSERWAASPSPTRPPARAPRKWPVAPTRAVRVALDEEDCLTAQHLWMNGVGIRTIAKRLRATTAEGLPRFSRPAARTCRHGSESVPQVHGTVGSPAHAAPCGDGPH